MLCIHQLIFIEMTLGGVCFLASLLVKYFCFKKINNHRDTGMNVFFLKCKGYRSCLQKVNFIQMWSALFLISEPWWLFVSVWQSCQVECTGIHSKQQKYRWAVGSLINKQHNVSPVCTDQLVSMGFHVHWIQKGFHIHANVWLRNTPQPGVHDQHFLACHVAQHGVRLRTIANSWPNLNQEGNS